MTTLEARLQRFKDRLVRKHGCWKIAQRRGFIDLPQRLASPDENPANN